MRRIDSAAVTAALLLSGCAAEPPSFADRLEAESGEVSAICAA